MREIYDADAKKWEGMHDLPQGAIEDVSKTCADHLDALRARTPSTCPTTRTTPVKSTTDNGFPSS